MKVIIKTNGRNDKEGLRDYQLAAILEVHPQTVQRWRLGYCVPTGRYYPAYSQWEVKGNRWFPKSQQSHDTAA